MLFDLWVLCLIATGLGMFIVSVIGNALSRLREHMQERHTISILRAHPSDGVTEPQVDAAPTAPLFSPHTEELEEDPNSRRRGEDDEPYRRTSWKNSCRVADC